MGKGTYSIDPDKDSKCKSVGWVSDMCTPLWFFVVLPYHLVSCGNMNISSRCNVPSAVSCSALSM